MKTAGTGASSATRPRGACTRLRGELGYDGSYSHRAALREEAARGDDRGALPQGRRGLPDPELAGRRGPG